MPTLFQLCIVLNNIQHVRVVLSEIGDELDLGAYYKFLDEEGCEPSKLSERAEELRKTILSSADEDIQEKKNNVVRQVQQLVSNGWSLVHYS